MLKVEWFDYKNELTLIFARATNTVEAFLQVRKKIEVNITKDGSYSMKKGTHSCTIIIAIVLYFTKFRIK